MNSLSNKVVWGDKCSFKRQKLAKWPQNNKNFFYFWFSNSNFENCQRFHELELQNSSTTECVAQWDFFDLKSALIWQLNSQKCPKFPVYVKFHVIWVQFESFCELEGSKQSMAKKSGKLCLFEEKIYFSSELFQNYTSESWSEKLKSSSFLCKVCELFVTFRGLE